MNHDKEQIIVEYVQRFDSFVYWPMKISGFCRFDIKNKRIQERSFKTLTYNILILCLANAGVCYLLSATSDEQSLKLPELIVIAHFAIFANLLLINSSFLNRRSGYELITDCVDIDVFLGIRETRFMRSLAMNNLAVLCFLIAIFSLLVVTYMFVIFKVSMMIHVVGSIYFAWLFCAYDDYCFFLHLYTFLSLRVKYLNIAIMELTNMKTEYIPKQLLFDRLIWKKEYDDKVTFHKKAGVEDFVKVFTMLFNHLRRIEHSYRFALLLGVWTNVMGTFVCVQAFIIYIKSSDVDIVRITVVAAWAASSWFFLLIVSQYIDIFQQQIEKTILICSYNQLKPRNSSDIFKLIKKILHTLEVREPRLSLYDLFYVDIGLVFKIIASTFVYITIQLQMGFPKENILTLNNSITTECIIIPPYTCIAV